MLRKNSLLLFIILIFSTTANSHPIFYKCDSNGQMSNSFSGVQIQEKVKAMVQSAQSPEEFNEMATQFCQGAKDCVAELESIKAMVNSTSDINAEILKKKDALFKNLNDSISEDEYENYKSIVDNAMIIRSCQEVKKYSDPNDFMNNNNDNFAVFYPKHNNYMYISGCMGRDRDSRCYPNEKNMYEDRIMSSLAMGADPYLSIALALMEGGTRSGGLNYLYLDPIGQFGSMGCKAEPKSAGSSDYTLESYSTYYKIEEQVVSPPGLANRINGYFNTKKGERLPAGESYYCRPVDDSYGEFHSSAQSDSCCLKLPFKSDRINNDDFEEALVFENVRKIYANKFRKKDDPAFRIQRFNGYSNLMGAAEGVPTFRSGANYYEDPAYGYQAMDYIINSIMTNPVFNKMVDDAKKKYRDINGRNPFYKSIMCVEKSAGTYVMDSEEYFEKHENTDRFKDIYNKRQAGNTRLTNRETRVLQQEIDQVNEQIPNFSDKSFEQKLDYYFDNIYKNRNTIGKASRDDSSYSWGDLSNSDLRGIGERVLGR